MHSVVFELKPSRALLLWVGCIHTFSMVVLLIAPLAVLFKVVGLGLLLYAWLQSQRSMSRRSLQAVLRIGQHANGQWTLELKNGRSYKAELKGDTFKHPCLMILSLQTRKRCFYVPIPRDALSDFEFRSLSARLSFF